MREKWQSWCSAGPTDFGSSLRPQITDHPPVTRTPSFSGSELIRSPQQVVSGFNFFFLCTSETFNGFYGAQEALISQASPTCAYVVPIHQVGTIANSFIREYKKKTQAAEKCHSFARYQKTGELALSSSLLPLAGTFPAIINQTMGNSHTSRNGFQNSAEVILSQSEEAAGQLQSHTMDRQLAGGRTSQLHPKNLVKSSMSLLCKQPWKQPRKTLHHG